MAAALGVVLSAAVVAVAAAEKKENLINLQITKKQFGVHQILADTFAGFGY